MRPLFKTFSSGRGLKCFFLFLFATLGGGGGCGERSLNTDK